MPLDFENNFIQPLLLDIQNGNIPDASTYCAKVGEYYEKTISAKEGKIIIPQTLVSPTLTSANLGVPVTVPISVGEDAYLQPNSYRSQLKMYRTLAQYYVNKELVSGQLDLEQSLSTLESIVRKQSFNIQQLKTYIASARNIKTQLAQLPDTIKDVKSILEDEVREHKNEIEKTITELKSEEFEQKLIAAGLGAPAQVFAEEFAVYNAVKNINFKNIASLPTAVVSLISYTQRYKPQNSLQLQNAIAINTLSGGQDSEFLKIIKQKDITERIKRIIKIAEGLIAPTTLGPLLATINPKTPEKDSKLKNAIKSYERFKQTHEELRPQLINLERIIIQEKQQVKALLKRKIDDLKEVISKKSREMAAKRAQKRALRPRRQIEKSPKKQLLKQAIDDLKTFRANNEENFRIAKTKMQLSNKILRDSLGLITKTKALKDGIIEIEIPELRKKIKKARAVVLDLTGATGSLNEAGTQASASYAQAAAKLSTSFSGDPLSDRATIVKELSSQGAKYVHANNNSDKQFIQAYLQEQGLQDIADPFILLAASTSASFEDYRTFMEQKQEVYEEYYRSIISLEVDYKKISDNVKRLNDEKIGLINPIDMTTDAFKQRRANYINRQLRRDAKRRARLLESQQKPPAKWSLVSILKAIFKFLRKIALIVVEVGRKLKSFIEKQKENAIKIAEKIKIATIASIPIPNYKSDGKTKEEAAKEKIAILKQYQAQLQTGKAKAVAIALASQAGSNLIVNLNQNKLRASENEKWLNQLADAKYKFDIVNVGSDDAKYKKATEDKEILVKNITSLHIIEKYIDILSLVFEAVKNSRRVKNKFVREVVEGKVEKYGEGFIEDLKQAALQIGKKVGGKASDGTPQIIADFKSNQLVSVIIDLFSAENDFATILSKLKTIFRQLNGNTLSSLLKSVDFTQALIDVEQKYLHDVQVAVQKIVGTLDATYAETEELEKTRTLAKLMLKYDVIDPEQFPNIQQTAEYQLYLKLKTEVGTIDPITLKTIGLEDNRELTNGQTQTKDARQIAEVERAAKLKAQKKIKQAQDRLKNFNIGSFNFYNEMIKLDNTITKRKGSFIIALMDRIIWQINYFENIIRKQVIEWLKKKKDELKVLAKKQLAQHEEKFAKVKQKLVNIDSAAMSAILGLSARSFWTGATWQNKQGTTFQMYNIGRFPKLKKNGLVDGSEALIREIAQNFQKQLNSARGQAIPQPSYGLPPITFTGYGT